MTTPAPVAHTIDQQTGEVLTIKGPAAQPTALAVSQSTAIRPAETQENAISPFSSSDNLNAAWRVATSLSKSSLVPDAYKNNIYNCMIALELAHRIGASVLMVMQSLSIVKGKPTWSAAFLIATVNTSKRFSPIRFRWEGKQGTDSWGCRAWAIDRETKEECIGSLITIGLAKAEEWVQRSGSKWRTMPEQMLMYRSASFWTRVYAPELSLGMQTREEAIDTDGYNVPEGLPQVGGGTEDLEKALLQEKPSESAEGAAVATDQAVQIGSKHPDESFGNVKPAGATVTREPGED
jgi:hypothetical protein